jgi:hypothetical protein
MENQDGSWMINKIDETNMINEYATVVNNTSTTSYATAWTNRLSLTYGSYSESQP